MTPAPAPAQDPAALGGPLAGLSFVAGILAALATAESPYPRPGASPEQVRTYFTGSARAARLSVAGQLLSAAALVPFTAAVARLARRTGRAAPPLRVAAVAGGALAAVTQVVSALASVALTGSQLDLETTRRLHRLAFLAGGPVHSAGLGVLVGVVGLAGLRSGALPRPLAVASLAVAPLGVLAPLSMVAPATMPLIPVGRFSALLVSGIAGVRLAGLRQAGRAP